MPRRIDWYYHRKGWTSCKRADSHFAKSAPTVRETVDAKKEKYGAEDLDELFDGATKVHVAKGKRVLTFDLKKDPPEMDELAEHVIGRSGNLRAPSLRMGKTWIVGYSDDLYAETFS